MLCDNSFLSAQPYYIFCKLAESAWISSKSCRHIIFLLASITTSRLETSSRFFTDCLSRENFNSLYCDLKEKPDFLIRNTQVCNFTVCVFRPMVIYSGLGVRGPPPGSPESTGPVHVCITKYVAKSFDLLICGFYDVLP